MKIILLLFCFIFLINCNQSNSMMSCSQEVKNKYDEYMSNGFNIPRLRSFTTKQSTKIDICSGKESCCSEYSLDAFQTYAKKFLINFSKYSETEKEWNKTTFTLLSPISDLFTHFLINSIHNISQSFSESSLKSLLPIISNFHLTQQTKLKFLKEKSPESPIPSSEIWENLLHSTIFPLLKTIFQFIPQQQQSNQTNRKNVFTEYANNLDQSDDNVIPLNEYEIHHCLSHKGFNDKIHTVIYHPPEADDEEEDKWKSKINNLFQRCNSLSKGLEIIWKFHFLFTDLKISNSCTHALSRSSICPLCSNYRLLPYLSHIPLQKSFTNIFLCPKFCSNVLYGCFNDFIHIEQAWKTFLDVFLQYSFTNLWPTNHHHHNQQQQQYHQEEKENQNEHDENHTPWNDIITEFDIIFQQFQQFVYKRKYFFTKNRLEVKKKLINLCKDLNVPLNNNNDNDKTIQFSSSSSSTSSSLFDKLLTMKVEDRAREYQSLKTKANKNAKIILTNLLHELTYDKMIHDKITKACEIPTKDMNYNQHKQEIIGNSKFSSTSSLSMSCWNGSDYSWYNNTVKPFTFLGQENNPEVKFDNKLVSEKFEDFNNNLLLIIKNFNEQKGLFQRSIPGLLQEQTVSTTTTTITSSSSSSSFPTAAEGDDLSTNNKKQPTKTASPLRGSSTNNSSSIFRIIIMSKFIYILYFLIIYTNLFIFIK